MSEQEEIEITEAYITKSSYPVLWIGENGFNITRYAKLITVKPSYYADQDEMKLILPTVDLQTQYVVFKPDRWYIVAGGVYPDLLFVKEIIYTIRDEDEIKKVIDDFVFSINTKYELASGIKKKTYAVIYEKLYHPDMFKPLEIAEGESIIAKTYPEKFKIFKRGNKLFIRYIIPKEDC